MPYSRGRDSRQCGTENYISGNALRLPGHATHHAASKSVHHRTKILKLPTHIAHIAKAPRANATAQALSKSAILPTLLVSLTILI